MLNNLQQIQKFLHPDYFYLLYFNCRKKDSKINKKHTCMTKLVSYDELIYNFDEYKQIAKEMNCRIYINLQFLENGEKPKSLLFPDTIVNYSYYNMLYKNSRLNFLLRNNYFTIDIDNGYLNLESKVKDILQDSYVDKIPSKTGLNIICHKLTINQLEDILKLKLSINISWCVNLYIPDFE